MAYRRKWGVLKWIVPSLVLLAVLLLAACQRGDGTPGDGSPGETMVAPATGTAPRPTGNLPAAPAVPVPTGETRIPGSPSRTPPPSASPLPSRTSTATSTPLPSATPTPMPQLNVLIVACDTGIDLFNRLGEVTNAYVRVQNVGERDASGVQITLEGSDEEETHPDKSYRVDHLPTGYEIALKLTVDTRNGEETAIRVTVETEENATASAIKESCRARRPDRDLVNRLGELFEVRRIREETP